MTDTSFVGFGQKQARWPAPNDFHGGWGRPTEPTPAEPASAEADVAVTEAGPAPVAAAPVAAPSAVAPAADADSLPALEAMIADIPHAREVLRNHDEPGSWRQAFDVANVLHTGGHLLQAARFYLRSANVGHPFPQNVLCAQMTCEIKAGREPSADSLARLLVLDDSHYAFIVGLREQFRPGSQPADVLELMGNSYESFHTGVEADCFFLKSAAQLFQLPEIGGRALKPYGSWARQQTETIPRRLHFYWNANPPQEITDNFERHRALGFFDVHVYDKQRAEAFLYDYYGREAKTTFLSLRHPSEEADFLRPHLIYAYGGHYMDADIRIRSVPVFCEKIQRGAHAVFALTAGSLVHNDYFCAERESPVLASIIQTILHNCMHFPGLSIDLKTGPGAFTRGLNRIYHRALAFNAQPPAIRIVQQDVFDAVFEDFNPAYKSQGMHWGATLR